MKAESISYKTADVLLEANAVSFRFDPPYTFTSGIKSPIYLDNRLIMSYPKLRMRIIKYYIWLITHSIGRTFDAISATATAAIPQGAWIAQKLGLPLVYVRSDAKKHGKQNKLEGFLKKGSNVLIIEDHISTAGSAISNAKTVRELGARASYVIATTTYETGKSQQQLSENKLKLHSLTTGKTIVNQALKRGKLTDKTKQLVDEWFLDPLGWGASHGF